MRVQSHGSETLPLGTRDLQESPLKETGLRTYYRKCLDIQSRRHMPNLAQKTGLYKSRAGRSHLDEKGAAIVGTG